MKKGLSQVQKSLMLVIGILAIVLASVLGVKGYGIYQEKKQEKEWAARNQEVQQEIESVQVQIQELAGDAEALQIFLDEQVNSVLVLDEWQSGERDMPEGQDSVYGEEVQGPEGSGNMGETENQGDIQQTDSQESGGETAEPGNEPESTDISDGGKDTAMEVSSGAIVIGEPEAPQEGQSTADIGQTVDEGQAGTDDEALVPEVGQGGLEAAADSAIIIDAPPAPKPPVEKPNTAENTVSNNGGKKAGEEDTVSGNGIAAAAEDSTVSGNGIVVEEEDTVSGNGAAVMEEEDTVSGNGVAVEEEDTVSGNGAPVIEEEDTVSGNAAGIAEGADTISGNAIVDGHVVPYVRNEPEMTLEERRKICSSYMETVQTNSEDKAVISNNSYDFSDVKIACLGDSITEGSNLDNMENYQQYSYPSVLKNILNAEEVYNLGIGGSSYGRYWDHAFVDRYQEIPEDADIILVMGGTNDGFAASEKELGSLEEKKARTFYGDVDELMRGLKRDYPDAKIIFATPLPNVLHDYLRVQRDYLLPQRVYANAVKELAAQYQIDVIDLYNSNLLDTHDAQVISNYMPDGVHGNPAGYQVLAEHMASSIIEIVQREGLESGLGQGTVSGNGIEDFENGTVSGNGYSAYDEEWTVSGNSVEAEADETVSGNGMDGGSTLPAERTLSPEDAKRLEEERLRAEKERLEREKEEEAKAAENNKKVAEDAVIIDPAQEPAGTSTLKEIPAETAPAGAAQGGQKIPDGTMQDNAAVNGGTGREGDYEYGGEAIVIQ